MWSFSCRNINFYYKEDVRNWSPFGGALYLKMLLSSIKLNKKDLIWYNNSQHSFWWIKLINKTIRQSVFIYQKLAKASNTLRSLYPSISSIIELFDLLEHSSPWHWPQAITQNNPFFRQEHFFAYAASVPVLHLHLMTFRMLSQWGSICLWLAYFETKFYLP